MTTEQVLSALLFYAGELDRFNIPAARQDTSVHTTLARVSGKTRVLSERQTYQHLRWMCEEAIALLRAPFHMGYDEDREKAQRWLGCIQGALWMGGWYTVDELRHHSKFGRAPGGN